MSKSASVNTRVNPELKEQAETILEELGLSMSTAMSLFLKQIVIHNGLPFAVTLSKTTPVALGTLKEEEFDKMMEESLKSYEQGEGVPFSEFRKEINKKLGL